MKLRTRVSQIRIIREAKHAMSTTFTVTVVDEGAGPYLVLESDDFRGAALENSIQLDFEEFHALTGAVKRLEAEWTDELAATLPWGEQLAGGSAEAFRVGIQRAFGAGPAVQPGGAGGGDDR